VLDVGCGNGYVLSRYAREGARVCGVDLTDAAVRLSVARFRQERLAGEFCVGNAEELPFADGAFDCVCSMGVLHHTPDTRRAVGEVRRVLKPGGRFIGMFYHRDSLVYRGKLRARSLASGTDIETLVNEVDGPGNPKGEVYSKAELRALFEGFREPELFAGLLGGSDALRRVMRPVPRPLATWLERRWGWFLYVRAVRP
jgi:SAM-dependent methyltransferase